MAAVLIATEAISLALERWWLTLLLLLAALRCLQRAANQPTQDRVFQGPLWWCTLLVPTEAASLGLRELRGPPAEAAVPDLLAFAWIGLLIGLASSVNWRRCTRH